MLISDKENIISCWSKSTMIIIPNGITSVGDSAFDGCKTLKTIDIPESVTSIGNEAFSGCDSLQTINIPESVTSIGNKAFWWCSSLQTINIPKGAKHKMLTLLGEEFKDKLTEI